MHLPYQAFIALRYLKSKRKEVFVSINTVISVLGVAISVMVLNITLAIITGFETELQKILIAANAHIVVQKPGGLPDADQTLQRIKEVPGVVSAYAFTSNQAMVARGAMTRGVIVRGVANEENARAKLASIVGTSEITDLLFNPAEISITRPDGNPDLVRLPPILTGIALAAGLGLSPKEPLTMFSPELTSSPQGLIPRTRRFAPVASFRARHSEQEAALVFLSLKDSQVFFGMGDSVTGIEVAVRDLFEAPVVAEQIEMALSDLEGVEASDWTTENQPLWHAIRLQKKVYFIVLLLLTLIASFSIVATLVMVVMEKGKDIAILKSMGATDTSIKAIFLIQGILIGGSGVVLGTLLGIAGCVGLERWGFAIDAQVFALSKVPVQMELANIVMIALAGFFITALAGIYPARRAARLRPAHALRFE